MNGMVDKSVCANCLHKLVCKYRDSLQEELDFVKEAVKDRNIGKDLISYSCKHYEYGIKNVQDGVMTSTELPSHRYFI